MCFLDEIVSHPLKQRLICVKQLTNCYFSHYFLEKSGGLRQLRHCVKQKKTIVYQTIICLCKTNNLMLLIPEHDSGIFLFLFVSLLFSDTI